MGSAPDAGRSTTRAAEAAQIDMSPAGRFAFRCVLEVASNVAM
jgi:hypothetical protein